MVLLLEVGGGDLAIVKDEIALATHTRKGGRPMLLKDMVPKRWQ